MATKTIVKKDMTKAELIKAFTKKVAKASPLIKSDLIRSLKYKNKATIRRYLNNARVDRDGNGIRL
jgi:hypothetical protein